MDLATENAAKLSAKSSMDVALAQYQGSLMASNPQSNRVDPSEKPLASSASAAGAAISKQQQDMYSDALHSGVNTKLLPGTTSTSTARTGNKPPPRVPAFDLQSRFHGRAIPVSADVAYRTSNNSPSKHNPDLGIHGIHYEPPLHYLDLLDPNALGYNEDEPRQPADPLLARSKPVLEPNLWGQLAIQATPYGHFAQICAQGADYRKDRNYVPDETDHVPAAGKRKTRWTRNDVGILKGEVAERGESIQYKSDLGSSCAAPNQDHFTYDKGTRVVDGEFPLGKMMLPHKH
eukprot:g1372.t1